MYPESKAAITGHEREPGYHFFLTQPPPDSLAMITDRFSTSTSFRRASSTRLYILARSCDSMRRWRAFVVEIHEGSCRVRRECRHDFWQAEIRRAIVAMGDESTSPSMTQVVESPARNVLVVSTPWKSQLIGVELWRMTAPARRGGDPGSPRFRWIRQDSVSDLLFVDGAPSLPLIWKKQSRARTGGTKFRHDQKVGLFWELYGKSTGG